MTFRNRSAGAPLVAHVIYKLDTGGLEQGLINVVNSTPEGRYRHSIICISDYSDFRNRIKRQDVEVVSIRKKPGRDIGAFARMHEVFRRQRPAIVHTRNLGALDALLPAVMTGVRYRVHGEHGWNIDDPYGTVMKYRWLRKLHRPLVSRYVAVSQHIAEYLVETVGINRDKIAQIYNGVDTDYFSPSDIKGQVREQLDPPFASAGLWIGAVGRMDPVKNHIGLIEAFSHVLQVRPELRSRVRLIIVGDGPERRAIEGTVRARSLQNNVWLPGQKSDVRAYYRALDIFVQPSIAEGISNTVLEAMACGLPVIASRVGGNVELVLDQITGLLASIDHPLELASALEAYITNPGLRRRHGVQARYRAESAFSLARMVERYVTLYDSLLER